MREFNRGKFLILSGIAGIRFCQVDPTSLLSGKKRSEKFIPLMIPAGFRVGRIECHQWKAIAERLR